ncbi:MAG: RNA polymerase factor sigma-54 [Thermodesulfobacteriota bacterium]|nr:MAG: RNA polymerase factor sigma-54 [Thermodesulfobacteriota bacterium]
MAFEIKQELKLAQSLVMTPQLQLAIKLLQMTRLDLIETVKEEMETNPVLEDSAPPEDTIAPEEKERASQEEDWESYLADQSTYSEGRVNFNERDSEENDLFRNISTPDGGLDEHLLWQLKLQDIPDEDKGVGEFIIGNIDEDGYLRVLERDGQGDGEYEEAVLEEIAKCTGAGVDMVSRVLGIIHQFDPLGAGSRTPRECLLIQARMLPIRDTVVEEIVSEYLPELARGDMKAIARAVGVSTEDVMDAARIINSCLNPAPGSGYGTTDARHIVPDAIVKKVGDEYVITLNEDGLPKLKISNYYRELLKNRDQVQGETKAYLRERVKSAMWLIKSLHQRQRTIYRVVEAIVNFQRDFLDMGLKYLKPLVLKDVAATLGIHESTVSRVTSNKYVETPRGLFELKYFFTTSMPSSDGSEVSSEYIKEKLRDIIEKEDSKHPLSDQEIMRILKKTGLTLARRTVAKYRESLGFLSSSRRKVRF